MDKKGCVRTIYEAGFRDAREWTDWYFNRVYNDEDALTATNQDGETVAALMLTQYRFDMLRTPLTCSYISGATTLRRHRGQGHMSALMREALSVSQQRGDAICCLIPAADRLYGFYNRFDFETVFFVDELRYTSVHKFDDNGHFSESAPDYETFERLEGLHPTGVRHSRRDFSNILTDNRLDGGIVTSVSDGEGAAGMAFATVSADCVTVRALLADNEEAAEAVLATVKRRSGEKRFIVWARPGERRAALRARAMARIIDVEKLLGAVAASDRRLDCVIRIHDRLLAANNGVFIIREGHVEKADSTMRRLSLDISIGTLTKLLFSSRAIGEIFSLPTTRPSISLMLD